MKKFAIIVYLFAISLASCSENSPNDLLEPVVTLDVTKKISYVQDVKPIIAANCISCHGEVSSVGSISLHNFVTVKNSLSNSNVNRNLLTRINLDPNTNGSAMPQGGPKLSQIQIDIITKWQTDGFAE